VIRVILIDIDNTLLDFERCAEGAMRQGFSSFGIPYRPDMFPVFTRTNNALWAAVEQGTLTRPELHRIRWGLIFDQLGIRQDGERFEQCFYANLSDSHDMIDGARELLEHLFSRYTLCAASNAPEAQQCQRLRRAGLLPFFQEVFTSEKIGCSKPGREFFDYCLTALDCPKDQAAIIGDSLSADIRGGQDFGIRTCWYNPGRAPCPPDVRPDDIVDDLRKIAQIF